MRAISSTLSLILAITIIAANAAANQTTVVYPTGIFPTDVQNVQAAIDQGGTVLLKATDSVGHPLAFNFGTPQHLLPLRAVIVQNDVSIIGEVVGASHTTVSGGSTPFRVFGGKNSIQEINFDGPLAHAILVGASSGTSITGNQIENVVPDPLPVGFTQADGIDVSGSNPADISGNLVISGNTFGDLTGDFAIGIQVDSVTANVTISNNSFRLGQSVTDLGFFSSDAIACIRCHSAVTISGNTIAIGPGVVFAGIIIIGGADARYHVATNAINSQSPWADGIDVVGVTGDPGPTVAAVIENNRITVHNAENFFGGIGLFGAVSNSTIQGNTIRGDAGVALNADQVFLGDLTDQVVSNQFLFNDIASVSVSGPSIFFGENTVNNLVRGQCVSVIDLGVGNDISCPNPRSHVASFPNATRQQIVKRALNAQSQVRDLLTQGSRDF
jgi:hypothetical protein